ncbi:hypothetical protein GOP47_0027949 [Adiantum capillus-veneris]|nr:hypothetical protein GOP47_0027949 [Adiantum capillus-veneris]
MRERERERERECAHARVCVRAPAFARHQPYLSSSCFQGSSSYSLYHIQYRNFITKLMTTIRVMHTMLLLFSALGATSSSTTLDVLVAFRRAITADPTGALTTWSLANQSIDNTSYCSWEGILCRPGTHQVKGIQLAGRRLQGTITPLLGQLSSLSYLNLSFNQLSGTLPIELGECKSLTQLAINDNGLINGSIPHEFANLTHLKLLSAGGNKLSGELPPLPLPLLHHLNLTANTIGGKLTSQLAGCTSLRLLDLSHNVLSGSIPASLGNLSHLAYLNLALNTFSFGLPPSLANCTHLYLLNLYSNQLSGPIPDAWFPQLGRRLTFFSLGNNGCNGSVPSTIALCFKLEYIELGGNHFEGQILHNLLNCTRLTIIDLWGNSFKESLPVNIGTALPHLTVLGLILNSFYGEIPVSLSNCSQLNQLILGFNYGIRGSIPRELFRLHKVNQLDLQYNALAGSIPQEIGNASSVLSIVLFNNNNFTGSLPSQLGFLPELLQINFEYNLFTGGIPTELSNCTKLFLIKGNRNLLKGPIPISFGRLLKLEHLILDNNQLSGMVPSSLSNCTRMTNVSLNNNLLEGPLLAAELPNMLYFDMSNNRLSGSLPSQMGSMTQVQLIDISFNNLSGSIPASLASCVNLFYLNLSSNHLTGSIPSQLADSLTSLVMLNFSRNSLSGSIPSNIDELASLQKLDLSFNTLSGNIPNSLGMLTNLSFLNISYNRLQGEIPGTGKFPSFSSTSFLGNPGLCSLKLLQRACPRNSRKNLHILLVVLAAATVLIIMVALIIFSMKAKHNIWSCLCSCYNSGYRYKQDMLKHAFLRLTLQEIEKATNNFSPANVLGAGGTGVVYKGVTNDGKTLAFKKLHLPRSSPESPFFAEVQAMRQAKHRNLVRILGYFSDVDNDILLLEYMPNGNLDQLIHGSNSAVDQVSITTRLPFEATDGVILQNHATSARPNRVRLAQGIAEGLAYLHHDCPTPIIHLDIKPTNILLDKDLEARITDFGLARIVQESAAFMSASTQHMEGTLGYTAPEYANMGKISPKCDVYSFGILLLEMLTGKGPTDDMFIQGETLATWVLSFKLDDEKFHEYLLELCSGACLYDTALPQEKLNSLLHVSLLCTREDPKARPTMRAVVEMLQRLEDSKGGSLSKQQKDYIQSLLS